MSTRRAWLVALGVIGTGSLVYVVVTRGFIHPGLRAGEGLGWPVLGILPFFLFGMWLLTATSSRAALYLAVGATSTAVGAAYETLIRTRPELHTDPTLPVVNLIGLTTDGLSASCFLLMVATFPDGVLTRRWQRWAVLPIWLAPFTGLLALVASDTVVMPAYVGFESSQPNQYVVPALEPLVPLVHLLRDGMVVTALGVGVFLSRAFGPDPETRRRLRVMTVTVGFVLVSWVLLYSVPVLGIEDTPLSLFIAAMVVVGMIALPVAGIHGILRYRAFDVDDADRTRVVLRSASALITVLYGVAVSAPAMLFLDRLEPLGLVIVTAATAVVLLSLRGLAEGAVRRLVVGDRDHHLVLLSELGVRLEQALHLEDVLARIAEGVREGLDASWVRVRVRGADGGLALTPVGTAGEVAGDPVTSQELVRGTELLGVIELGPRRRGGYDEAERRLLGTVARQATTTVANVRLTAQLGEQLDELAASRSRLITVQDEERRRIERNLHDGVQQSVVALIASLGLARQRLQREVLRPNDLVELQDQARETLADLRELAQGIHPQVLTDRGLVAAVESRTSRFPVPVAVLADAGLRERRFPDDIEGAAFYTVSEALANVAKHAGASCARVHIGLGEGVLRIEVVDDGRGLRPLDDVARAGGLTNIRDRVAAVGGRSWLDGGPDGGARVVVELPVPQVAPVATTEAGPGGTEPAAPEPAASGTPDQSVEPVGA